MTVSPSHTPLDDLKGAVDRAVDVWARVTTGDVFARAVSYAIAHQRLNEVRTFVERWDPQWSPPVRDNPRLQRLWRIARAMFACGEVAAAIKAHDGATVLRVLHTLAPGAADVDAFQRIALELDPVRWPDAVRTTLATTVWEAPLDAHGAWELVETFLGRPRQVAATAHIGVLLFLTKPPPSGFVAWLGLQAIPEGSGRILADPVQAFVEVEETFQTAITTAGESVRALGLWPDPQIHDIRWTITSHNDGPLPFMWGPSGGLAYALGLAKVLVDSQPDLKGDLAEEVRALDLTGVAATAQLNADLSLKDVGEAFAKLVAARNQGFPRIHTAMVSSLQRVPAGLRHDPATETWVDPIDDFQVKAAASLDQALRRVRTERWHGIDCQPGSRVLDFVGRERLFARVLRFVESDESGYLVLVGGMGQGKSTFLAEWLHRARARGDDPVFHIIDYQKPGSTAPDAIALCLYARLRKKYGVPEEQEWTNLQGRARLTRLLDWLSTTQWVGGEREVLYIDAADQADLSAGTLLIPQVLGRLPRGVRAVVTSRTRMDWLAKPEWVTVEDLDALVDDRADVTAWLTAKSEAISPPPLTADLIAAIRNQAVVPRFVTVRKLFERLLHSKTELDERTSLQRDSTRWTEAPAALVAETAIRLEREALRVGVSGRRVWFVMGALASAREPLNATQLEQLGIWTAGDLGPEGPDVAETVLRLAADFFLRRAPGRNLSEPYRFDHPGYYREVHDRLTAAEVTVLHARLAAGCQRILAAAHPSPARDYALRHRLRHLIAAEDWPAVGQAFADIAPIVERCSVSRATDLWASGFGEVCRDAQAAASHPRVPLTWRAAFEKWTRFLVERGPWLARYPEQYAQEVCNEFLRDSTQDAPLNIAFTGCCEAGTKLGPLWLNKVAGPAAIRPTGHTGGVTCVAWSPDGRLIASGDSDGSVRVWNAATLTLVATLDGHTRDVGTVVFSPDSRWVASAGPDSVRVCWADTGAAVAIRQSDDGLIDAALTRFRRGMLPHGTKLAFSPDGRWVVSGEMVAPDELDVIVRVWEAATGATVSVGFGHSDPVTAVAWAPHGRLVASASLDGTVRVWDPQTGALRVTHKHAEAVIRVSFARNGRLVASASLDGFVHIWDSATGSLLTSRRGCCFAWAPDGRRVATGGDLCNVVEIWDGATGELLASADFGVSVTSLDWAPNGSRVAAGGSSGKVRVWNVAPEGLVEAGAYENTYKDGVIYVVWAPNGRSLASAGKNGAMRVWDTATGTLAGTCQGALFERQHWTMVFSSDGSRTASMDVDHKIRLREVATGTAVVLSDASAFSDGLAFSPDDRRIALPVRGRVCIWEASSDVIVATADEAPDLPIRLAFSPDGRCLAAISWGAVRVLDAATGALVAVYNWETEHEVEREKDLGWSPDVRRAAEGSWGVHSERVWRQIMRADVVARARHGRWFASSTQSFLNQEEEKALSIWDAASGETLATGPGHTQRVIGIAWAPDARWVASASMDCTVRLWDPLTGRQLAALLFDAPILAIVAPPDDSRRLVAADATGRFFVYQVDHQLRPSTTAGQTH